MSANVSGNAAEADNLAKTIIAYWKRQGKTVKAWVEATSKDNDGKFVYEVKSDLVNGLPQRGRA
jgi:hypothetical protein